MRQLITVSLCFLLASCAGIVWNPEDTIQEFIGNLEKYIRKPGENLISHPNTVWEQYDCSDKKIPFLVIEKNELAPATVNPGEEFNHRLIYALCVEKTAKVIIGNLYRKIYFRGKLVFNDVSKDFELKPGKWSVDAFIAVPPQAKPGIYSLLVVFNSNQISFERSTRLVVKEPPIGSGSGINPVP